LTSRPVIAVQWVMMLRMAASGLGAVAGVNRIVAAAGSL
jgi:hypothetical protein